MCACPSGTMRCSRRLRRLSAKNPLRSSFALLLYQTFPNADRTAMPSPSPCIGVCSLPSYGQILTVPYTAIAADLAKSTDVHRNFTPQFAFDHNASIDMLPNPPQFRFSEITDTDGWVHLRADENLHTRGLAYPEYVRESHIDTLISRNVNPCNSSQSLPLPHPCR